MPQLLNVSRREPVVPPDRPRDGFPFSVPAIRSLDLLDLSAPVTFFVGENGSGKSTLLEGIAAAAQLPTLGSEEVAYDVSLGAQRALASTLKLTWRKRTRHGFFLRAEDFFGYLKRLARDKARVRRELWELGAGPPPEVDVEWGAGAHPDEAGAAGYLGEYDARSHGESFLELFTHRIDGTGLYLLDEPEAPLSPQRQLALLALLSDAVAEGAQFVVATHSPILLAFPGARIYSFDTMPVEEVAYGDLEHVNLTRDFLLDPERYLRHLR
ncbi:MAG TPA: AAA family ATPase [Longimicrobiaceae bacterium]|nr:AAA family ATPase [Longimicrobiaceae bacterium]